MNIIRTAAFVTLFSMFAAQAEAQLKTWINVESGPLWSMLKVSDPGGYFQGANVRSYVAGVTFGQEILPNLSLHTGVLYAPQTDGINMDDKRPNQSGWPAFNSIFIPVRAEYTIQPTEYPVCFTPRLGYVYHSSIQPDVLYQAGSILSSPDGTTLSYDIQQLGDPPVSHLLEVGMGVNMRFPNKWQVSVNLSYMTGLGGSPVSRYTLEYSDWQGNASSTEYTSKGNTLLTTMALNIPVSNIWQNRDYRIRARVENSVYKGKPVTRRGQVYLGGEIGPLWRSLNSTNPAIGPRPMEERGIFQYSNLHTGLYAGYMLTGDLGFDLGAYYQRSSTFYAIMYDHRVDFVTRMPAPLYLEFPLRFRYFYNVYKNRVHMVFYGGGSLLVTFSKDSYNQGTAGFTYSSGAAPPPDLVTATTTYEASGLRNLAPALRLGTGFEYVLPTKFPLIATLYVNYMQGFLDMGQIAVTNTLPETPSVTNLTYNGSGWSAEWGIKVPFRLEGTNRCGQLPEINRK
jgi:hypothetical protein